MAFVELDDVRRCRRLVSTHPLSVVCILIMFQTPRRGLAALCPIRASPSFLRGAAITVAVTGLRHRAGKSSDSPNAI